jgi:hypothetical protein
MSRHSRSIRPHVYAVSVHGIVRVFTQISAEQGWRGDGAGWGCKVWHNIMPVVTDNAQVISHGCSGQGEADNANQLVLSSFETIVNVDYRPISVGIAKNAPQMADIVLLDETFVSAFATIRLFSCLWRDQRDAKPSCSRTLSHLAT